MEFLNQQIEEFVKNKVEEILEARIADATKELSDKNAELQEKVENLEAFDNADLLEQVSNKLENGDLDTNEIMETVCKRVDVNNILDYIWDNYDYTFAEFAKDNLDYDTRREITIDFVNNEI